MQFTYVLSELLISLIIILKYYTVNNYRIMVVHGFDKLHFLFINYTAVSYINLFILFIFIDYVYKIIYLIKVNDKIQWYVIIICFFYHILAYMCVYVA